MCKSKECTDHQHTFHADCSSEPHTNDGCRLQLQLLGWCKSNVVMGFKISYRVDGSVRSIKDATYDTWQVQVDGDGNFTDRLRSFTDTNYWMMRLLGGWEFMLT